MYINYAVEPGLQKPGRIRRKHIHWANEYLTWGAGPRASQYLILGAKCHAVLNGKYSPDIEDVKAVAYSVLRHRICQELQG